MNRLRWIPVMCFFAILASADDCFGQCHPFKPVWPPCRYTADQLAKVAAAAKQFNPEGAALNTGIEGTRRNLWALYPDKQGFENAEMVFYEALWNKDMYYLILALPAGMNDRMTRLPNIPGVLLGTIAPEDLDKFPKTLDGGIRPFAFPLFAGWVNALRRREGREETQGDEGAFATPFIWAAAVQDQTNWRYAYEDSRNWAEIISSGLDISKSVTQPEVYLKRQMESHVSLVLARSKPAELPDPIHETDKLYDLFVEMFTDKDVVEAADAVLHTPKNSVGGLAKREDVAIGTYSQAPSPNPFLLFLTKVTNRSRRNYAIALCLDQYAMLGGEATATFNSKAQWDKAFSVYNQVVTKYGEANVLSAAGRLQDAQKDSQGGLRADAQSKGVLFWFTTLLKDPKAVIPDGQLAHFRASSYDSHWLGKTVEVRGTVSRVDLAKGFPPYATIHFKESRNDAIVGYTPNSDMLQGMYGTNFSNLVGRPVEIWGEVGEWGEGAGVRILARDQVKVLDAATGLGASFTDSRPEWLTAAKPVETLVDSPKYLAWKKFPPGTTVTYENRLLHEYTPGSNQYTRSKISQDTLRLESINDTRAIVLSNSTVWHANGQVTHSPETKLVYPAKQAPGHSAAPVPNESGEETLQISGKKFATRWQSAWGSHTTDDATPDPETFTKTWTSEEVPGGVVLTHQQEHTEIVGKTYRNISETILVPVENVEPELGSGSSSQTKSGALPAQPATPNHNTPAVGTMNRPDAKAAPTTPGGAGIGPVSSQAELAKHFNLVMTRAARARVGLAQLQRRQAASGPELPVEVRAARDRLDAQLRAGVTAMRARDNGAAEQCLHGADETLMVIERYLEK